MRDPVDELQILESAGLRRRLRRLESPQGITINLAGHGTCLNFSSNDYLGLADNEELKIAYLEHIGRYGGGSGASRLVCGTMAPHEDLEQRLAELKGTEAALTFTSGFAAAIGTLPALCGKNDFIILDKLCHASLIDGARLSGATLRIFPHNDLNRLESHLRWAAERVQRDGRILVVTESVFSMDGDLAPLAEICDLKETVDALLLVDEAHAFGVLGPAGRGLGAALGVDTRIDLQMGTFSKAIGLSGGYICTTRPLVDLLVNKARSFIYSTAPGPALAATVEETLDFVSGPRGDRLRARLQTNREALSPGAPSAIIPLILGENDVTLAASSHLQERGFLVPAIRYPTVPKGSARLRLTLSAAHTSAQIDLLKDALAGCGIPGYAPPL
ncbi:MAG: 8-amino-7-oxononanoate synthase [Verrucomicrobiales bacterium]|jgi:8-amino-7-oxononanoate synthase|nr:8-amino-7-oxononanoate synthase [Verrucomicrobiales bacterium]MBP9223590.1 8-amino-7-oxononanoate synthase [Verrucomicrobiales bacterium]HQZ28162.1 8-amino-7-oxononanoate synthase [Verrucomicrobiales bacterium]